MLSTSSEKANHDEACKTSLNCKYAQIIISTAFYAAQQNDIAKTSIIILNKILSYRMVEIKLLQLHFYTTELILNHIFADFFFLQFITIQLYSTT